MKRAIAILLLGLGAAALALSGRLPAQQPAAQDKQPPKLNLPKPPPELLKQLRAVADMEPQKVSPDEDRVRRLLKERVNTALRVLGADLKAVESGQAPVTAVSPSFHMLRGAWQDLNPKADVAPMLKTELELARAEEQLVAALADAGRAQDRDVQMARFTRMGAELELLQAQKGAPEEKGR